MGILSYFGLGGSGEREIEESDLLQDLPADQRKYFVKEDLKLKIESKQAQVEEDLQSGVATVGDAGHRQLSAKEIKDLQDYKRANTRRAAVLENCSEVQMLLLECLKNGSYSEKFTLCNDRTKAMFTCIDMQKTALSQLGFDSARSIEEAESIKGVSDDLFVKYFGKEGLGHGEESNSKFLEELEYIQINLWK